MKSIERLTNEHKAIQTINSILENLVYKNISQPEKEILYIEKCIYFLCLYINEFHKTKEETILKRFKTSLGKKEDGAGLKISLDHNEVNISLECLRNACFNWRTNQQKETTDFFIKCLNDYLSAIKDHINIEEHVIFKKIDSRLNTEVDKSIFLEFTEIENNLLDKDTKTHIEYIFFDICSSCL